MLTKRIPWYYAFIGMLTGGLISYYVSQANTPTSGGEVSSSLTEKVYSNCSYSLPRLGGYNYIRPLLFAEQICESENYAPLKENINHLLNEYRASGTITSASIYLKNLDNDAWIAINGEEKFDPGSLMKIPVLITFLRMAEDHPQLLDTRFHYNTPDNGLPTPTFRSKAMQPGQNYTVRELLTYMIVHSDNNAAEVLLQHMDDGQFQRSFTDLGLPSPQKGIIYPFSARDYSVFMKVLYDGTYLTMANSEYATSLLVEAEFKQGIVSGLPANIKTAHKFGEWGDQQTSQLHETGIVYLDNSPYLLTVMTKGPRMQQLPQVVAGVSKLAYESMTRNGPAPLASITPGKK